MAPAIQNSIHIHITPTNAEPPSPPEWLQENIEWLPGHLSEYREKNLVQVRQLEFIPSGLSSETAAIAKALGSCLVDAPELQQELVALLRIQDRQQLIQRSGTTDGLVVEAVLVLSRQERERVFTSEIAAEANRLLELRAKARS